MRHEVQDRCGLPACLKALCPHEALVVWRANRSGSDLTDLPKIVQDLSDRDISVWILACQGTHIDEAGVTRCPAGCDAVKLPIGKLEDVASASWALGRERGRKGGRKFALTKAQVQRAQIAMTKRETSVTALAEELGVRPVTLYRYVGPTGELRAHGRKVLEGPEP